MNQYGALPFAVRARWKIKRELLRAPVFRTWSENRYRARVGRHAENLPWLPGDSFDIFADLKDHGVAIRNAVALPLSALEVADRLASSLREGTSNQREVNVPTYMPEVTLPTDVRDIAADLAPLYEWGLANENLDLAERYIGLPVCFHGVAVRRERTDGPADLHTRRWHVDIDDRRMLKIIIYLNDVGDGGGPFEYISGAATDQATRHFRYSTGYLSDASLAGVVPPENWMQVTGPRLSAVFVDPKRLFHRVQPPSIADRYSLTYTYTSARPLFETFSQNRLSARTLAGFSQQLTPRQRRAAMVR